MPAVAECFFVIWNEGGKVSVQQSVPSEIEQGAGDVVVPVETIGKFPSKYPVIMVVEHYHLPAGYAAQKGLHVF